MISRRETPVRNVARDLIDAQARLLEGRQDLRISLETLRRSSQQAESRARHQQEHYGGHQKLG